MSVEMIINYQLSIINYQLSIINYQLSIEIPSLKIKLFIKMFNFNYLRKENVKEIFNNDKFNDSI